MTLGGIASSLSRAELRTLLVAPALLHIPVLATSSLGLDFVLAVVGGGPVSPARRIEIEWVNIVLMAVASLLTFLIGVRLIVVIGGDLRSSGRDAISRFERDRPAASL